MASILFVHGAWHGGWCWREHFTGWFEARDFTVSAPDLPHHGEFDHSGVKKVPLTAYVEAVGSAASVLEPPVILVGHSMGGFIIQKYLEKAQAELAVLVASTPPNGAGGTVKRMARHHPVAFLKTMITSNPTDSPATTRDYFFSPETPDDIVNDCHRRLQTESTQVLKDMMKGLHPERVRTPVVVLGAENDWLVAATDLANTAQAFSTSPITLPGGHDMMLDIAWEQVAKTIEESIAKHLANR